jgi:hypothetical protein
MHAGAAVQHLVIGQQVPLCIEAARYGDPGKFVRFRTRRQACVGRRVGKGLLPIGFFTASLPLPRRQPETGGGHAQQPDGRRR